jgi:hypothetical protein
MTTTEKPTLKLVKGGEEEKAQPLAFQTYDHGQWQSRPFGRLLPTDTLEAALTREGFDPSSRTVYLNPHSGTRVEFYTRPNSRPAEFLAFIKVAAARNSGVPTAFYLPNDQSVDTLLSDLNLELAPASAETKDEAAA